MLSNIYVGFDIGGTLSKVSLLSDQQIIDPTADIFIDGKQKKLSSQRFQNINQFFQWIKVHLVPHQNRLKVGITGGGATKYNKNIKEILSKTELHLINQFQSNVKGIQFISKANLPIVIHQFVKTSPKSIELNSKQTNLSQSQLPLQFISVGSGVNFNKIGLGANGFERLKVDDPKTSFDGYQLQGTCLGGGYIFGLIGLLSQQRQAQNIVSLIKNDQTYKDIYSELIINLMQSAIELSIIHNTPTILPSGSILTISSVTQQFQKAMLLNIQPFPFRRHLISLESVEGYLGSIGALYSKLNQNKEK